MNASLFRFWGNSATKNKTDNNHEDVVEYERSASNPMDMHSPDNEASVEILPIMEKVSIDVVTTATIDSIPEYDNEKDERSGKEHNGCSADSSTLDDKSYSSTNENQDEYESFPAAKDFLADFHSIIVDDDEWEDQVVDKDKILSPELATEIVTGFNDDSGQELDDNSDNNDISGDAPSIITKRTTATNASTRVRPINTEFRSTSKLKKEKTEERIHNYYQTHKSIFDILDRNFKELGDYSVVRNNNSSDVGNKWTQDIGHEDVQLCFVAFIVVFSLPSAPSFANCEDLSTYPSVDGSRLANDMSDGTENQMNDKDHFKGLESTTKRFRPKVPLSLVFALWRRVLRLPLWLEKNDASLFYIRSTLVLLGLLEITNIDKEDAPVSTNQNKSSMEALYVHHDINYQYGEYLALGKHDRPLKSKIAMHERIWNDTVMHECLSIEFNEYTVHMLPLNTMRANHMQDTFDLLKEKTFVRRRIRTLGASEAAKAHIRDVNELLSSIEERIVTDSSSQPIDEQNGVLSAFEQMKKYFLYMTNELTKHHDMSLGVSTVRNPNLIYEIGKAALSQIGDVGHAMHLLGVSLGGYGFFEEELEYYREALRLKEVSVMGDIHQSVSVSDTLHCMGFSLDNAGRSNEALDCYDRALDIRLECLGEDDLRVAETLHNKGALLCEIERSDEAMECLEEALRIRELHYGEEHESCADTMQWMGNLLRKYGDPYDSLDYFKFALRIKQTRLGCDHVDVAHTLFNTAVLLDDIGKYELSMIAYKEAYRIRKLSLGENNLEVADTLFCMGNVATVMEKHEEALAYLMESIEIRYALLKNDDRSTEIVDDSLLFISNPISVNPCLLIQYQKLVQCLEEALPLTKLIMGTSHKDVLTLLKQMGDIYKKLHDWDNSIGSFQGAIRIVRADSALERDDTAAATILQKKGEAHLYKEQFSRAKSTFDAALRILEKLQGRESLAFGTCLYCLGVAYHYLKNFSHARFLFQECIRIQNQLLGDGSVHTVLSLCWLGRNHEQLGDPSKALEFYLSALQICKKNKTSLEYRTVIMLLHAIGGTYENEKINLLDMALKCFLEEINLIHTKLDSKDGETTRLLSVAYLKVGMLYKKKQDVDRAIEYLEQALEMTTQIDQRGDTIEATIADNLGVLFESKKEYIASKKHLSSAYSIYEKNLGRDHITTSDCAFRLGKCLECVGSNLALDFYKESLRVHRLNVQDDDERIGDLLFYIGKICSKSNAEVDAAKYFEEALIIRKKILGDCSTVADTYHQLGNVHYKLRNLEKALIFYKESTRVVKKIGENDALYKVSFDMAQCCEDLENFLLAIECYNDCLRVTKALNDNKNIALVLLRMGEIQMKNLQNYSESLKLLLDALELIRCVEESDVSYEDTDCILNLLFQIGRAYTLSKDYENALDYYEEHIKRAELSIPIREDLIANSLFEIANIHANVEEQLDYHLAIDKMKECLALKKKVFGPNNEQVANVLHTLATIYEKAGYYDDAVSLLSEALRTFKMKQSKSETSKIYHTLAKLKVSAANKSGSESDHKAALECYEEAIKERRQDIALDDLDLVEILYEYSTLLCYRSDFNTAMPFLEEALRIQKSKKGFKDAQMAKILLRIAEVHVHNKTYDSSLVFLEQALFIDNSLDKSEIDLSLCHRLLGITHSARGDFENAVSAFIKSLKIKEMEFGLKSLECAAIHNDLGKAYGKNKNFEMAIESLVEALRVQKVELGNDSFEYATTVFNLAEIHFAMKKHNQALNCLDESIRVFAMFSKDESSPIMDALEMKAECHFALKEFSTAASVFEECLNHFRSSSNVSERLASLSHKLGKSLANMNDYDEAATSFKVSIELYGEIFGADNLHIADVMYDVGLLTYGDGELERATQCFAEVIRIYTLHDERNCTKMADSLVQMGTIHADNAETDVAKKELTDAITIYRSILGEDATEIGKALLVCGRINDTIGEYDESMANFTEALRIFQKSLGDNDMSVSVALSNIGVIHARKLQFAEAVEKCKEALRIRKLYIDNDRDVADSLFNIGNIFNEWNKLNDALPFFNDALKLYRESLEEDDIALANCQQRLGTIYLKNNDIESALDSFSDALLVCEQTNEDIDHILPSIYKGLGDCYFYREDFDQAMDNFVACLNFQKTELGDDSIEVAEICDSIGVTYQKTNEYTQALSFHTKALQIYETHLGKSSSRCLFSHIQISKSLMKSEKYDKAIAELMGCIALFSNDDGNHNIEEVAAVYHQLGVVQNKSLEYEEAISSLNKALDIRVMIFGYTDIKVAETLLDLGRVLQEWADLDEAIAVYDKAISILQNTSQSDQCTLGDTYVRVAELLVDQGKYELSLEALKKALKIYSSHCGRDSIKVGMTLIQLGKVYDQVENLDRSTSCLSEGIKIMRSNALISDRDSEIRIAQALNHLGRNFARKKLYNKAIEFCTESLKMQKEYGDNKEFGSIADSVLNIGNILNEWGKGDQALQFYEEALKLYSDDFGADSVEAANCLHSIALVQQKMGTLQAALANFGKALRIHRFKDGDNSLSVATDLFCIGQIYESFNDLEKSLLCFQECLKIREDSFGDDNLDLLVVKRYVDTLRKRMKK